MSEPFDYPDDTKVGTFSNLAKDVKPLTAEQFRRAAKLLAVNRRGVREPQYEPVPAWLWERLRGRRSRE